jgi:hypothetical protein
MLKQRRQQEALDTEISVDHEQRIREDERRRVLAELAGGPDGDATSHEDADWRTAPPPVGETPVADPRDVDVDARSQPTVEDPRRWDVPDDRWEHGRDDVPTTVQSVDDDRATPTDEVPATAYVAEETVTERGFSPGQLLIALAGACALALGIVAVARTGLERPLSDPVEPVLGWDHTALLGLFEIGAGALMLLSSLRAGARWLGGLVGLAAIAGGVLIVAELDDGVDRWIAEELGAERAFGWVAIAIGAAAVLGALIPRVRRERRVSTSRSMLR